MRPGAMPFSNCSGKVLAKVYTRIRQSCSAKPTACMMLMISRSSSTPDMTIMASLRMPARMNATAELDFTKRAMATFRENAMQAFTNKCGAQAMTSTVVGVIKCALGHTKISTSSSDPKTKAHNGMTSRTYVIASSLRPRLDSNMACRTIFVHSKSWLVPCSAKPVQEKLSSPWMVRVVAMMMHTRIQAFRQLKRSKATASDNVYTSARFASFII
mmetsp:Transcript_115491/g.331493  ORF Transcript_115491/g.331493 Transcript_115491/m.331493 type:complete len:215 (-) Transcript_115491:484-1128(-)